MMKGKISATTPIEVKKSLECYCLGAFEINVFIQKMQKSTTKYFLNIRSFKVKTVKKPYFLTFPLQKSIINRVFNILDFETWRSNTTYISETNSYQ